MIPLESIDSIAKAKEDLKDVERKLWICAYVSRKENPLIDGVGSVLLLICSYYALRKYFTDGAAFPVWVHVVALIAITLCLAILHRPLNRHFTKKAEARCPIHTSSFDPEEIQDMEHLAKISAHGYFKTDKTYQSGPLMALAALLGWVGFYLWFAYGVSLPIPPGCLLYLIVMCVVTSVWFFFTGFCTCQSLLLPLSPEVKTALRNYQKEKREAQRKAELEKAKQKQKEPPAEVKPEPVQKTEESEPAPKKANPAFFRDLPIYQQYREEAKARYGAYSAPSNRRLTDAEKQAYIDKHFSGLYSYSAIEAIEKDPNLSLSQKEDLKTYIQIYGD